MLFYKMCFLLCLLACQALHCNVVWQYENNDPRNANAFVLKLPQKNIPIIVTIPKCGTHLLFKAIELLSNIQDQHKNKVETIQLIRGHVQPIWNELFENSTYDKQKKILLIRDPRDALISQIHWILTLKGRWVNYTMRDEKFHEKSFYDQLTNVILFPNEWCGMKYAFKTVRKWSQSPNTYLFKFEDLVGPQGGGTLKKQIAVLTKLAELYNFDTLCYEDYVSVANNLFGNTHTFRVGKISNWKKDFTDFHKDLVKQEMNDEIVHFGYEKDLNW